MSRARWRARASDRLRRAPWGADLGTCWCAKSTPLNCPGGTLTLCVESMVGLTLRHIFNEDPTKPSAALPHAMTTYTRQYQVNPDHVDVQGIVDGLYYPFYLENCRHCYVRDVLSFDIEKEAANGINMVLAEYTLRFRRSLKKGDSFEVTCRGYQEEGKKTKLYFQQQIILGGTVFTDATFIATCVPASGGRPFIPESITAKILATPSLPT